MRKAKIGALDFETRNSEKEMHENQTSMWLGVLFFSEEDKHVFTSLEDMFTLFSTLCKVNRKKVNHLIYVHNLAWEFSFIIDFLMKNDYTFSDDTKGAKTFSFLGNASLSTIYSVKIRIKASGGLFEMRDSARLYMCSLAKLAKQMGIAEKGEIDYTKERSAGYIPTDEEISYCVNDCRIVRQAIAKSLDDNELGNYFKSSLTAGSFAAKVAIGKYGYSRSYKPMQVFRKDNQYPVLVGEERDFARKALSGGLTWVNPEFQFIHIPKYHHIDIHSAHPNQARKYPFPFGFGTYGKGRPPFRGNRITIAHVRYSYDDIIVPAFISTKDLRFVNGVEAWLFDFEIILAQKAYVNFRIDEYIDFYEYSKKYLPWRDFYSETFEKKKKATEEGDMYNRTIAKLFLNAGGYGKFVERGHHDTFVPFIDESDGIIKTTKITRVDDEDKEGRYTYTPMGAMIPARTRYQLVSTALKIIEHGGEVIYTDTDSIFFVGADDFASFIETGENLGNWGIEKDTRDFEAYVPKRYIYRDEKGKMQSKAGGFNNIVVEDVDDFFRIPGYDVLTRKRVRGGSILFGHKKELKVPEKYAKILKENRNEIATILLADKPDCRL